MNSKGLCAQCGNRNKCPEEAFTKEDPDYQRALAIIELAKRYHVPAEFVLENLDTVIDITKWSEEQVKKVVPP